VVFYSWGPRVIIKAVALRRGLRNTLRSRIGGRKSSIARAHRICKVWSISLLSKKGNTGERVILNYTIKIGKIGQNFVK
jgi:hypothetical protein